jgi:hypothetical protein
MARNPKTTKASSKKHKKATPRRKSKTPKRSAAVIPPDSDSSSSASEAAQLSPDPAAQDHFSDVDGSPSVHSSPRASHQTDRSSERNSPLSSPERPHRSQERTSPHRSPERTSRPSSRSSRRSASEVAEQSEDDPLFISYVPGNSSPTPLVSAAHAVGPAENLKFSPTQPPAPGPLASGAPRSRETPVNSSLLGSEADAGEHSSQQEQRRQQQPKPQHPHQRNNSRAHPPYPRQTTTRAQRLSQADSHHRQTITCAQRLSQADCHHRQTTSRAQRPSQADCHLQPTRLDASAASRMRAMTYLPAGRPTAAMREQRKLRFTSAPSTPLRSPLQIYLQRRIRKSGERAAGSKPKHQPAGPLTAPRLPC